jgi:uncharacterized protein (TIGR03435 family)
MNNKLVIGILAAAGLWAQTGGPKWEEFSIGAPAAHLQVANLRNGIRAEAVTLRKVVSRAFSVPENRIFGPAWMADERYALTALSVEPKDFEPLMQRELAQRFQMLAHRETKVVPVFVLKPSDAPAKLAAGSPATQGAISGGTDGRSTINLPHTSIAAFASLLGNAVGRPVLDETHLDDAFDIVLRWKAGSIAALQDAVTSQLGLQLVDEQRPVELVVIDHIEKLHFSQ